MFNSKAISSIRFIALCMIVTCHVFQGENIVLAWWFNVGVQIFLFMSGFLYGTKVIDNTKKWMKKRLNRILIPYYLFLGIVIVFYLIFARNLLNINKLLVNLLLLQGFCNGLPGIEHLWFISYILLCSLITPILQAADFSGLENTKGKYITKLILILTALEILSYAKVINISIPNISAYIIGYYFSRRHFYYEKYQSLSMNVSMKKSTLGIFTACILTTPLVIYMEYFYKGGILWFLAPYEYILFQWNHTILGITLFLIMYLLFDKLYNRKIFKPFDSIIKWSDEYSYPVYVTHQIVILGQFSLLAATANMFINIVMIILFAIISGMILQKLNCLLLNKIEKHQKKILKV